jgi:tetratricopeptide (TPR) repeat protein
LVLDFPDRHRFSPGAAVCHNRCVVASSSSPGREALQLLQAGRNAEALPLIERAVAGARVCLPAHGLLPITLSRLKRPRDADAVIVAAMGLGGGVADAYDALAYASMALGRHERASNLYRRAAEVAPGTARFWYNLAACDRGLGRLHEADASCDRAIEADRGDFASYLLRSELRVQTSALNHVDELAARLAEAGEDARAQMLLGYALAKELDDLGRFDEAFHWFSTAARAPPAPDSPTTSSSMNRKCAAFANALRRHRQTRAARRTAPPSIRRGSSSSSACHARAQLSSSGS